MLKRDGRDIARRKAEDAKALDAMRRRLGLNRAAMIATLLNR